VSWRRLGRIFCAEGHDWIPQSIDGAHKANGRGNRTQVPTPLLLEDRIRVYFSTRDTRGRSYPLFIDVDRDDPTRVIQKHKTSLLSLGEPGTFDEDGVMPSFVLHHEDRIWMYYSGWNAKISTPYHNATGLAESRDGGVSFERVYEGPVMDRTPTEPQLAVTPTILKEDGIWKCWYISGIRWVEVDGYREPVYGVKYATSKDGVYWDRPPALCIPQQHPNEAFSHPSVLHTKQGYEMWYCFRGCVDYRAGGEGSYRIGYAHSEDGLNWTRADHKAGMSVSEAAWEDKMVCYPFVLEVGERRFMFYNGNGFGAEGIGVAEWIEPADDDEELGDLALS